MGYGWSIIGEKCVLLGKEFSYVKHVTIHRTTLNIVRLQNLTHKYSANRNNFLARLHFVSFCCVEKLVSGTKTLHLVLDVFQRIELTQECSLMCSYVVLRYEYLQCDLNLWIMWLGKSVNSLCAEGFWLDIDFWEMETRTKNTSCDPLRALFPIPYQS